MLKAELDIATGSLLDRKNAKGLCVVVRCGTKKGKDGKMRFCHKHGRQHQKITNPLRYYYDAWRQNARRRCKDFTVTFEQYKNFCAKTNYLEKKGRFKDCYSIDRIDDSKGYHYDNIQILRVGDNSRKQFVDAKIREGHYPSKYDMEIYKESFSNLANDIPEFAERKKFDPNNDYSELEKPPF